MSDNPVRCLAEAIVICYAIVCTVMLAPVLAALLGHAIELVQEWWNARKRAVKRKDDA